MCRIYLVLIKFVQISLIGLKLNYIKGASRLNHLSISRAICALTDTLLPTCLSARLRALVVY